ncbi:MAG TPA: alpha/beta hydrolase [Stellaceae bacterium]|nr:alpha/beta hydrolase [Stellaceae bacterium]
MKKLRWLNLVFGIGLLWLARPAFAIGFDPAYPGSLQGPEKAAGIVIWSHGRSLDAEDWQSPNPPYLRILREAGWDVVRFNRLRDSDTLPDSTRILVDHVAELKKRGYKRIVLAGQSFGAFLSLMAADASTDVDAVVATAPAAYGDFEDAHDTWRLNATRLYPLIEQVKHARVMLFFFHGDDFDPGGRGEHAQSILSAKGLGYTIVDQPAFFVGHWSSSTGLFVRRFGGCIRDFAEADHLSGEMMCKPSWGQAPSAELKLPDELTRAAHGRPAPPPAAADALIEASSGSGTAPQHILDTWYGFYPNGREVLLAVDSVHGKDLSAIYAIGPSIDETHPALWSRRSGHIVENEFVFDESGKSLLRFHPTPDGGLTATWVAADGKVSMSARLRRIDPRTLASGAQPQ